MAPSTASVPGESSSRSSSLWHFAYSSFVSPFLVWPQYFLNSCPLCQVSEQVGLCTSPLRGNLGFLQFSGFHRCPSHRFSNLVVGPHLSRAAPRAMGPSVELYPVQSLNSSLLREVLQVCDIPFCFWVPFQGYVSPPTHLDEAFYLYP